MTQNMKTFPDPNKVCSCLNSREVTYIKPTISNLNIIVGDFTYSKVGSIRRRLMIL